MKCTSLLGIVGTLLFGLGSALAVDGVILIDQNKAMAGNVTPGDTPGFPVTISQPGSYRLSGNLTVPADTDAIVVTTDDATLDLNGFTIKGPTVCTSSSPDGPVNACNGTFGIGVYAQAFTRTTVVNGVIRGFRTAGVRLGLGARVEKLIVEHAFDDGIFVGSDAYVHGNRVGRVVSVAVTARSGSVVSQNTAYQSGYGFIVSGSTLLGNHARRNLVGIHFRFPVPSGSPSGKTGWANNVLTENGTATTEDGGGPWAIQMGGNVCNGVSCP